MNAISTCADDKDLYRAHKYPVISGQKNRLASHLRTCKNVTQSVKDQYRILSKRNAENECPDDTSQFSSSATASEFDYTKRRKLTQSHLSLIRVNDTVLTKEERRLFHNQVLKGTIAGGLPFRWVEHSECKKMFSMVRQQAKLPSRQHLAGRVLNRVYEEAQESDLKALRDCDGLTVAFDGWNNVRREHLMAVVVITENGDSVILRVEDVSVRRKDGETCEVIMKEVLQDLVEMELRQKVVGIVSDAGSDCKKGRRLIVEAHPELLSVDCLPHQWNLLVADVFKALPSLRSIAADSVSVINWFNNHSRPLGYLRMEQRNQYNKEIILHLPCATRWGTHEKASSSLLASAAAIQIVVASKYDLLMSCVSANARQKAIEVLDLVQNRQFWRDLEKFNFIFRPLTALINICQSDDCRLDTALESMAKLSKFLKNPPPPDSPDHVKFDSHIMTTLSACLDKRWKAMDQVIFICSYCLNPLNLNAPHVRKNDEPWNVGTMVTLLRYLHLRLYNVKCERLFPEFTKYYQQRATLFQPDAIKSFCTDATNTREWWKVVATEVPNLAKLALHLSAFTPHSAAVERIFSSMGHIHSRRRNKLGNEKVMKMTKIKTTLMREQKAKREQEEALSVIGSTLVEDETAEEGGSLDLDDVDDDLQPISTAQEWEAEVQAWMGMLDENETEDPQYFENIVVDDAFMKETVKTKWKLEKLFDFSTLPPIVME